jgi:hypothetical protein
MITLFSRRQLSKYGQGATEVLSNKIAISTYFIVKSALFDDANERFF